MTDKRMKRWVVRHITKREIKDNYQVLLDILRRRGIKSIVEFAPPHSFDIKNWTDIRYKSIGLFGNHNDIKHDLETHPYPIQSNSADIVVMSHILEHLRDAKGMVDEARRVSRKWLFISLPNEMSIMQRKRMLFGTNPIDSDFNWGHRYFLHTGNLYDFVDGFCGLNDCTLAESFYCYGSPEGRYLIRPVRNWLANAYPALFAHQWLFLYNIEKETVE